MLGLEQVRKYQAVPIQANPSTFVVAVCDPTKISQIEDLRLLVKRSVEVVLTSYSAFDAALQKYYGASAVVGSAIASFQKAEAKAKASGDVADIGMSLELVQVHEVNLDNSNSDAPVISLVNGILADGIRRGASDIHVEPYEKRFRVRLRIDGALYETAEIPMEMKTRDHRTL